MSAASRDSDWRPDPPTPTSSMLPPGIEMMREMRVACSIAKRNMTSGICVLLSML